MIELFSILLTEPKTSEVELQHYQCTVKQLETAREVFVPCIGEKHFQYCYEVAIKEHCEVKG